MTKEENAYQNYALNADMYPSTHNVKFIAACDVIRTILPVRVVLAMLWETR